MKNLEGAIRYHTVIEPPYTNEEGDEIPEQELRIPYNNTARNRAELEEDHDGFAASPSEEVVTLKRGIPPEARAAFDALRARYPQPGTAPQAKYGPEEPADPEGYDYPGESRGE
ncbi:MAG: hypothetical protein WAQ57_02580 [Candidatus Saccharimonadales bacterium]